MSDNPLAERGLEDDVNQSAARKVFDDGGPRSATPAGATVISPFAQPGSTGGITGETVRRICELRRKRNEMFPARLFGDPTWDMLLQLYAARLDMQRLSITRLTKLCGVPATTVLRRLGVLETEGLVTRTDDPLDGRRVHVALSFVGAEAMERSFAAAGPGALLF
jgi:DNA-binding MarR family transcriptional regulator